MRVADAKPGRRYHVEFDAVLQSAAQDGWVEFQDSYGCDVEAQLPPSATLTALGPKEPTNRFAVVNVGGAVFVRIAGEPGSPLAPWRRAHTGEGYAWFGIEDVSQRLGAPIEIKFEGVPA